MSDLSFQSDFFHPIIEIFCSGSVFPFFGPWMLKSWLLTSGFPFCPSFPYNIRLFYILSRLRSVHANVSLISPGKAVRGHLDPHRGHMHIVSYSIASSGCTYTIYFPLPIKHSICMPLHMSPHPTLRLQLDFLGRHLRNHSPRGQRVKWSKPDKNEREMKSRVKRSKQILCFLFMVPLLWWNFNFTYNISPARCVFHPRCGWRKQVKFRDILGTCFSSKFVTSRLPRDYLDLPPGFKTVSVYTSRGFSRFKRDKLPSLRKMRIVRTALYALCSRSRFS